MFVSCHCIFRPTIDYVSQPFDVAFLCQDLKSTLNLEFLN